jgi:cyclophilin family peptidyl-prolyl cis-trans isomerase/HEAT repeat protein
LGAIGYAVLACLLVSCSSPEHAPVQVTAPEFRWQNLDTLLWAGMLAAEDARVDTPEALDPIMRGLSSQSPETRVVAVRALGRMERASLLQDIVPLLADTMPVVRAEAANALGQAVFRGDAGLAMAPLVARLGEESDAYVRGVIAQTLGRLPYESSDTVRLVDAALVGALDDSVPAALAGVVRGLESLVRRQGAGSPPSARALERLRNLARYRSQYGVEDAYTLQIRRLAMAALVRSGQVDASFLVTALVDRDAEVRRLAVGAASTLDELDGRLDVITRALSDDEGTVRLEALRAFGRRASATTGCGAVIAALDDPDPDVALTAIDLLGSDCGTDRAPVDRLTSFVEELEPGGGGDASGVYPDSWHRSVHALVALARVAPAGAARYLETFAVHEAWWVRMYAARAAAILDSSECLERLAHDDRDNVREAAIAGLSQVLGHEAGSLYVEQLTRRDYQLIMTAARALDGTPNPWQALPAMFDALERITAERRETSRDPRRALIRRIGSLGGRSQAVALTPYLRDFDPAIAEETAQVLLGWTGREHAQSPQPLAQVPLPSFGELAQLAEQTAVLEMRDGGEIELQLLPFEAPTNVARFAWLARERYFDGLTFHRVVGNFVIQGGSPGANEFVGDGPFSRDELTLRSNLRGTVGISTRGRDTGDGQIFVNIVDNPRLDHNYTIIAEVVDGMDVVDGVIEGAVIERISWKSQGAYDETS